MVRFGRYLVYDRSHDCCHDCRHDCCNDGCWSCCCIFYSIWPSRHMIWVLWFTCFINSAAEPHINQISKRHSTNTSPLIGRHRRRQSCETLLRPVSSSAIYQACCNQCRCISLRAATIRYDGIRDVDES